MFAGVGVLVVAGLVVLVLALTGVFGDDDKTDTAAGATPDAPVRAMFDGIIARDAGQVRDAVCDQDDRRVNTLLSTNVTSYTVGDTTKNGEDNAKVEVTLKFSDDDPDDADINTVREDGAWKVCLSSDPDIDNDSGSSDEPSDYSSDEPSYDPSDDYSSDEPSDDYTDQPGYTEGPDDTGIPSYEPS